MTKDKTNTDKQHKNNKEWLAPFQWKKGQSGNLKGRKKGKTMKEYAKELLQCQTEQERQDFLNGIPKSTIWEMAEGRPDTRGLLGVAGDKESLEALTDFFKSVANKKK